jgi:uncharacterized protein (DUF433 family)
MATPLSLRFKEDTLQRLYFQAKLAGMPPRTLAQRMVEEALRMTEHPLIDFTDNGPVRRAFLRGTGLEVWEMIDAVKGNDGDVAAAAEATGRSLAQVEAAIAYYGAYPDDIDDLVEANERAYQEGRAAYLAGLERLAG